MSQHALPVPFGLRIDAATLRHSGRLETAVAAIYDRMRAPVIGYVYQLVGSTQDAEDILQFAFLRLWDHLEADADIQNIPSWIYRVVHNRAIDQARRAAIRRGFEQEEMAQPHRLEADWPETATIRRQEIGRALEFLTERERHALTLRAEGLSYREIGEVLGISAKAVSVYLVRGLKKFEHRPTQTP
jgi:RNA polymerase sigma-70 factor (ECF subfamily)